MTTALVTGGCGFIASNFLNLMKGYLPTKAIAALSDAEYAATTRAKRKGKAKGKQFVAQPKAIARKVRKYRT